METSIKIKNLSVTLGAGFKALKNINLELPAGKKVGLIGPSGAGKTTLMRAIVGRLKITKGDIKVFCLDAGSSELRKQLSYMTQELSVYSDLTIEENLRYFISMSDHHDKNTQKIISDVLAEVDLSNKRKNLVRNLSTGQKQRVSLAVALIGYPKLMILDEPTVGLDPVLRDGLWKLFDQLAKNGTTLIVSSHSMDEAERCDDLVLIRDGKVLAHDTPKNILKQTKCKTIEHSFLKLVGEKK